MENPQDQKAAEILVKIEVGIDCVVRSTVRGVVVSAEVCPGNWFGVVEVDHVVLLKFVFYIFAVRSLLQFPVSKNGEKTKRGNEEKYQ